MNKITSACLLAAMAALSLGASAAGAAGTERIAAMDTDGDGYVSRTEAEAHPKMAGSFDAIDTDRDGRLSPSELRAYGKAHKREKAGKSASPHAGLGKMDTNGDGLLTREEAASSKKLMRNFDTIDSNKDGRLSADEVKAARTSSRVNPAPRPAATPAT